MAADDFNSIVEICKSETAKRMSCTIHTDLGPLLLVNWYRPPDDDATLSMPIFRSELATLVENHVGTIVLGDFRRNTIYSWKSIVGSGLILVVDRHKLKIDTSNLQQQTYINDSTYALTLHKSPPATNTWSTSFEL